MIGNFSQPLVLQAGLLAITEISTRSPYSIAVISPNSVKSVELPSNKVFKFKEVFTFFELFTY